MTVDHRVLSVTTHTREEMVDITHEVRALIPKGFSGIVVVSSPHTTAGLTLQENADPDVRHDVVNHLRKIIPQDPSFRHMEGNADAHIKTSLVGNSVTIPVVDGTLVLGTWQAVYFCEFDGPRTRRVHVSIVGE